jgi:hypothetical protein
MLCPPDRVKGEATKIFCLSDNRSVKAVDRPSVFEADFRGGRISARQSTPNT